MMAIGDNNDTFARLKAALPSRWFGLTSDSVPVVDSLLAGISTALSFVYSLYVYAKAQTRILTASDGWLDLIAADFFGTSIQRAANQTDASFRARIILNMFRERATRNGLIRVLEDLTGRTPTIIELTRPADTGAYGAPNIGYGLAGAYGSLLMPYQCFVTAYRPLGTGIPNVAGYGVSTGGYGQASQAEWASLSMIQGAVQDADIYAAIEATRPVATIVWTNISSGTPQSPPGYLGSTFVLGNSQLV